MEMKMKKPLQFTVLERVKMVSLHIFVPTLSLLFLTAPSSSSSSPSPSSSSLGHGFTKIYAFGDSYTDTGNTGSATGPSGYAHVSNPPYGMTYFHHPTNRYSDGRLLVDFVAAALSLPFLPPYLSLSRTAAGDASASHGANFAVAGATAIEHEFFVRHDVPLAITPQSLATELGWFDELMKKEGCSGDCASGALFWVGEIGANDYAYTFATPAVTNATVQALAVNRTLNFARALLNRGATTVVVQGLPMLGCLPLSLYLAAAGDRDDLGCVASMNQVSRTHNDRLLSGIGELRRAHPGAAVAYADYWNAHRAVVGSPARFGLREAFRTCCGSGGGAYNFDAFATCGSPSATKACADPAKYVNWDGVHFTEAMNAVLAELFLRGGYMDPPFTRLISNSNIGV